MFLVDIGGSEVLEVGWTCFIVGLLFMLGFFGCDAGGQCFGLY